MRRLIRVLSEDAPFLASSLIEDIRIYLKQDDFELRHSSISDMQELSIDSECELIDLLYIPANHAFDSVLGRSFAAKTQAKDIGVYVESMGPLIMQGGKYVLQRFFADRTSRHDIPVYEAGKIIRSRWKKTKQDEAPLPKQIYLGLTQICNRSCSFCVSRSFSPAMLSLDVIRGLAKQLRDDVYVIALTGAGEAMMHPEFWRIVDILSENIPNVQFKMNSSGVALGKAAERLLQYPFRNITISLNAATPDTYHRFIGGSFEQVMTSIKKFVVARALSASNATPTLTLSMVLMNSTVSELPDFVSRAFELGVEEIQGIYLMVNDSELEMESPWHQPERSNSFLDLASERAAKLGVGVRLPPRFNEGSCSSGRFQPSSLPETQGQACVEPWSTIYIRPDGDIISCPYSEKPLGNILNSDLEVIWNGHLYRGLRESLLERDYWDMCEHCCGFNEVGRVDDYLSHWLGERKPSSIKLRSLPVLNS